MSPSSRDSGQAGYSLVALMVAVAMMLIMMTAALPVWEYVIKNEREEELIFRGGQIADAIQRYQRKRGNTLPTSLEMLVKEKFLRKEYEDPMTQDGKWRFIRRGAPGVAGQGQGRDGRDGRSGRGPRGGPGGGPGFRPGGPPLSTTGPGAKAGTLGPIIGVASTNSEQALRVFNGQQTYSEWLFVAGQPRVVGKTLLTPQPGKPGTVPRGGQPPGAQPPGTRPPDTKRE